MTDTAEPHLLALALLLNKDVRAVVSNVSYAVSEYVKTVPYGTWQ